MTGALSCLLLFATALGVLLASDFTLTLHLGTPLNLALLTGLALLGRLHGASRIGADARAQLGVERIGMLGADPFLAVPDVGGGRGEVVKGPPKGDRISGDACSRICHREGPTGSTRKQPLSRAPVVPSGFVVGLANHTCKLRCQVV